jgi:hypothetical protein
MTIEASYGTPVYRDKNALCVKEGSTGVVETGAIANVNTVGQAPVIHRLDIGNATGNTDIVLEHKTRIINAWAVKTAGNGGAGDTVTVQNGANAITDAMSLNCVDTTIVRAGTINDANAEIAAGGTLRVAANDATDPRCTVYVLGIRVV